MSVHDFQSTRADKCRELPEDWRTWEELLSRRIQLLAQLRAFVAEQEVAIQAGEVDRLLEILAEKQSLLNALEVTEQLIARWRANGSSTNHWPPQEWPECLRKLWHQAQEVIAELVDREKACGEQMELRRAQVAAQLEAHVASAKAQEAYRANWDLPDSPGHIVSEG